MLVPFFIKMKCVQFKQTILTFDSNIFVSMGGYDYEAEKL